MRQSLPANKAVNTAQEILTTNATVGQKGTFFKDQPKEALEVEELDAKSCCVIL